MKIALVTILVVVLAGLAVGGYYYAGGYNVAATEPHTDAVLWFLDRVQANSIRAHAVEIEVPPLDDSAQIETGISHFHQMCVTCHGAPGVEASEIGKGLYPEPPNLARSAREFSEAELFWVLKNGIKMTGMPAYGPTHDDGSLWGIVAFLKRLPELSSDEYRQMVIAAGLEVLPSSGHGGGHAHGEPRDEAAPDQSGEGHTHPPSEYEPRTHDNNGNHQH